MISRDQPGGHSLPDGTEKLLDCVCFFLLKKRQIYFFVKFLAAVADRIRPSQLSREFLWETADWFCPEKSVSGQWGGAERKAVHQIIAAIIRRHRSSQPPSEGARSWSWSRSRRGVGGGQSETGCGDSCLLQRVHRLTVITAITVKRTIQQLPCCCAK